MSSTDLPLDIETHRRNGHTVRGTLVVSQVSDVEIMFTREIDAPRELVFETFLDPRAIPQWWGPARYTTVVHELDARPGGRWRFVSRGADGAEYGFHGEFQAIDRYDHIVQTFEFEGAPGHVSIDTADFRDLGGRTLVIGHSKFDSPEALQGMAQGGMEDGMAEGYDRLATYVAERAANSILIERVFDAPREVVWEAWTKSEHLMKWWAPEGMTTPGANIDLRVGGTWHYCMRDPQGNDFWATGHFLEIVPMAKLVATDSFSNANGDVVPGTAYGFPDDLPLEGLIITTFADAGPGRTKVTLRHSGFPAGEHRDMAGEGWRQMMGKLAAELSTMR